MYSPSSEVLRLRVRRLSRLVMVIRARATGALVGSVTTPAIVPVGACPWVEPTATSRMRKSFARSLFTGVTRTSGLARLRANSQRKPNTLHQVCKPGVGTKAIEHWTHSDFTQIATTAFLIDSFQPGEGLILVAQTSIDNGKVNWRNLTLLGQFLYIGEHHLRFAALTRYRISIYEPGKS